MKTKLSRLFMFALAATSVIFLNPLSSYAATAAGTSSGPALNIELSPLPVELAAKPGQSVSTTLRFRNTGDQPETLKLSLQQVSQVGQTGQINLSNFASNNPLPSWVHFSSDVVTAPAGEWETDQMTINLPKTAAYGYYFAVQFQLATGASAKGGTAAINGATDIFVLLNAVAPGELSKAEVTNFSVGHKVYQFLPASFSVQIHSIGNVSVQPYGNIFITQGGKKIATLNINQNLGSILPNSYRIFTSSWSSGFPSYKQVLDANGQPEQNSNGNLKQHLTWNFADASQFRFGHYTAHLVMIYQNGTTDIPINATVGFWVLPWTFILAFILIILLILVGLYSSLKRFKFLVPKTPKKPKISNKAKSQTRVKDVSSYRSNSHERNPQIRQKK